MRIASVTFDGFNELDSVIALGLLNRLGPMGCKAELTCPSARVTSMSGVTVEAQQPLAFANDADAVILGSGIYTRVIAENGALMHRLTLDPLRQSVGAQCCGRLLLARLGLLGDRPSCTDPMTKPWVVAAVCGWSTCPSTRAAPSPRHRPCNTMRRSTRGTPAWPTAAMPDRRGAVAGCA